jgi:hypothetical protein
MTDTRGVATTLNYVLGLAIALVLITGLLIAGGTFVETQRDASIRTELAVVGEQVSSDVQTADRLAQTTTNNETVRVGRELPPRVAGNTYQVRIEGGSDPRIVVRTIDPEINVTVPVRTTVPVARSTASGGSVVVNYTAAGELELEGGR